METSSRLFGFEKTRLAKYTPEKTSAVQTIYKYVKNVVFLKHSTHSYHLKKYNFNKLVFVDEMAIPPGDGDSSISSDHPLSDGPESAWSTFFKDNEFLLQIDKDVRRLCPDISFFQQVI